MVVCPRCKTRNAGDAKFCKECNWSIVLMEETAVISEAGRAAGRPRPLFRSVLPRGLGFCHRECRVAGPRPLDWVPTPAG